jgi:hypothetical protein
MLKVMVQLSTSIQTIPLLLLSTQHSMGILLELEPGAQYTQLKAIAISILYHVHLKGLKYFIKFLKCQSRLNDFTPLQG